MNKYNLKVGQEVYLVTRLRGNHIVPIEKIGRKYFYLEGFPQYKFCLDTLREKDYIGVGNEVYLSKEEYDNSQRKFKLEDKLRVYPYSKLSLETLEKLNKIIEEDTGKKNE